MSAALWDTKTLCAQLGVGKVMAWRMRAEMGLPYIKLGRAIRYKPEAVEAWLAKRACNGGGVSGNGEGEAQR